MLETLVHQYKGWEVRLLENRWIKLYITPELGGRIIQTEFDSYNFFFVNPSLEGKMPNSLAENGAWMNFGGEKIWPAPQGWGSPDLWPGPPDPVLDSGPYTVSSEWAANSLEMVSMVDEHTGLQIRKNISISADRSEVIIQAVFVNRSGQVREWSVWPVFQLDTGKGRRGGRYGVTCPVNPESVFPEGYKVMHGLVNNPQNSIDANSHLHIDYQYLVGKVGLDSHAEWTAFCDRQTGKVFVATFEYQPEARYPDNTSVQVWTQGRGMVYSRNRIMEYPDDVYENPPYLEIELLSPLYQMEPGEEAHFEYRMLTCTIPAQTNVQQFSQLGIVAEPLEVIYGHGRVAITGRFGVFMDCQARIQFRDKHGVIVAEEATRQASPSEGLDIQITITHIPAGEELSICLDLYDDHGAFAGELNRTRLCRN